jgi:hypothetical protein
MEKEFVTYEQALALKELGFDERCFANWFLAEDGELRAVTPIENEDEWYDENWTNLETSAPLKQQVFRWFREKYFLDCEIYVQEEHGYKFYHYLVLQLVRGNIEWKSKNTTRFKIYEEAESACIDKLIELAKTK